jgi:hypothetical protein
MGAISSPPASTAVHFCPTCGKPFTNGRIPCFESILRKLTEALPAPSLHRHVQYCGSRTRSRPRSCLACNASKVKCNFEAPCSRCIKKGVECVYKASATRKRPVVRAPEETHTTDSTSQSDQSERTATDTLLGHDEASFSAGFAFTDSVAANGQFGTGSEFPSPGLTVQNPSLDEFLALDGLLAFEGIEYSEQQSMVEFSMAPYDKLDMWSQSWCGWMHRGVSLSGVIERHATQPRPNHALVAPLPRPIAQHNADLVIQSVRAFPTMMLRRETFPWFIHKHSNVLPQSSQDILPEALSNCMSIAQMFALRTSETKSFLWRTIRGEYRRLSNEVCLLIASTFCTFLTHERNFKCPNSIFLLHVRLV